MSVTLTAYIEMRKSAYDPWQRICLYRKNEDGFTPILPYQGCANLLTIPGFKPARGLPADVSAEVRKDIGDDAIAIASNFTWYTVRELELIAETCSRFVEPLLKSISAITNIDDDDNLYYHREVALEYKDEIGLFKIFLRDIERVLEEYEFYNYTASNNFRVILCEAY